MNISPSFSPNISPRSLKMAKKMIKSRKPKLKMTKEEEELKKCTFRPSLNSKTKQMFKASKSPVFRRLAKPKPKPKSHETSDFDFSDYHQESTEEVIKKKKTKTKGIIIVSKISIANVKKPKMRENIQYRMKVDEDSVKTLTKGT